MKLDVQWEDDMVKEFKNVVGDLDVDDSELRQFLRARNHDMDKAELMIRKSMEWRKTVQLEEALHFEIPDEIIESFPLTTDGKDKDGRVAIYFPVGRWKIREMISNGQREEMERYIYHVMSYMKSKLDSSDFDQFVIILDLAGLSYSTVSHYESIQIALKVFREYEQNCPERLFQAFVINAPWIYKCVFPLIKPLLTGAILSKVSIFDANPDKYLPVIFDRIPKDSAPSDFLNNLGILCA